MEDEQRRALVAAAVGAREKAYAKYSDFPVGAALLCRDGSIVTGIYLSRPRVALSRASDKLF